MVKPCVFLDRDGVIVVPEFRDGRSFAPKTLANFAYYPDILNTLRRLKDAGYLLIVVTNQPNVGNKLVEQYVVETMHKKMLAELPIDHIEVCYHSQQEGCHCRKPQPGMLLTALKKFEIDVANSFMIGDRYSDIEAGHQLNLTTFFIDYGYNEPPKGHPPHHICKNLTECVNIILRSY